MDGFVQLLIPTLIPFPLVLGPEFFASIVDAGIAKTLIGEPPRRLMNDLVWAPEIPTPLTKVHELIVRGVCRVRNGEKFRGGPDGQWERDVTLIKKAHVVLQAALAWPAERTNCSA